MNQDGSERGKAGIQHDIQKKSWFLMIPTAEQEAVQPGVSIAGRPVLLSDDLIHAIKEENGRLILVYPQPRS
jgi:hypothetical protein